MRRCLECGQVVALNDPTCSLCGSMVKEITNTAPEDEQAEDHSFVSIARFSNAAEAGFFAHELTRREGVPVSVMAEDNFDAVSGYWSTGFLLTVPENVAEFSAHKLQGLVNQGESFFEDSPGDFPYPTTTETTSSVTESPDYWDYQHEKTSPGIGWVPLLLTITAGTVAVWGFRKLQEIKQPAKPAAGVGEKQQDLWRELSDSTQPWVQSLKNQGQRRLVIDSKKQTAELWEDADGDGQFERRLQLAVPQQP